MKEFYTKHKIQFLILIGLLILIFGIEYLALDKPSTLDAEAAIQICEEMGEGEMQTDCWYTVIRSGFREGGSLLAFDIFKKIYETSDLFVSTGCHRHAHRVGDISYYEDYLTHKDITKMKFPHVTSVCGYGYFHGFIEHLIQDNPYPQFVRETCDYLDTSLTEIMPSIRITCFHGSGHGFALSGIDTTSQDSWGDPEKLIGNSLSQCEALQASRFEVEECKEGVFNVLVEWMSDEQYGLTYNHEDPFWFCREQEPENKKACYYEMAQKQGIDMDVVAAAKLADSIGDEDLARVVFIVTVSGMMQLGVATEIQYDFILACREVPDYLKENCIKSITGGMMEHGNPGEEHIKLLEFCQSDILLSDERSICFDSLLEKMARFNADEFIYDFCEAEDNEFRKYCRSNLNYPFVE